MNMNKKIVKRMAWFNLFLWSISYLGLHSAGQDNEIIPELPLQRSYRQTETQYTVELFMVVDYAAYKWWYGLSDGNTDRETETLNLINQYYTYVFSGIDLRFQSIDNQPFGIEVGLAGIYVAESEEESEWTSGSTVNDEAQVKGERLMVNSSEALEKFQTWIDENTDLPSFDHAVLFTGTNLTYAGSPGNTGLAFASSMCRNISNSSIVEDSYDFRTITFAAQQIARSLGASDDMDNNDCLEFFNYIMTPKLKLPNKGFPSNRWRFSTCSVTYFQEYLDILNEEQINCLLDTTLTEKYPLEVTSLLENLPGQTFEADQQCRHAYGLESFVCRTEIKADYKSICYGLPCYFPRQQSCRLILPADGTPCGSKKHCMEGKCSTSESADDRPDSCAFGNSPKANCSGVGNQPSLCYQPSLLYDCCGSCLNVTLDKEGCEFGDRIPSCTLKDCISQGEQYATITCCLTCEDIPTSHSALTADGVISMQTTSALQAGTSTVEISKGFDDDTTANTITVSQSHAISTTEQYSTSGLKSETVSQTVTDTRTALTYGPEIKTIKSTLFSDIMTKTSPPTSFEMVSGLSETFQTRTKVKRSSPVIFTKSLIQTADPIQSPAVARPMKPTLNGYQTMKEAENTKQDGEITTESVTEAPFRVPVSTQSPYIILSTTSIAKTDSGTTEATKAATSQSGATVSLPRTSAFISTRSPVLSTKLRSTPATPCPTLPAIHSVKDWDRNLNLINKQFFSKFALTMKADQKSILFGLYGNLISMYQEVGRIIKERQDQEANVNSNSDSPSFEAADLLQKIGPIWRKEQRQMLLDVYFRIKKLRYRVLALTRNYITRKAT